MHNFPNASTVRRLSTKGRFNLPCARQRGMIRFCNSAPASENTEHNAPIPFALPFVASRPGFVCLRRGEVQTNPAHWCMGEMSSAVKNSYICVWSLAFLPVIAAITLLCCVLPPQYLPRVGVCSGFQGCLSLAWGVRLRARRSESIHSCASADIVLKHSPRREKNRATLCRWCSPPPRVLTSPGGQRCALLCGNVSRAEISHLSKGRFQAEIVSGGSNYAPR